MKPVTAADPGYSPRVISRPRTFVERLVQRRVKERCDGRPLSGKLRVIV